MEGRAGKSLMQLIFAYNARSGLFNKMSDFAHKMLSPSTYDCSLCRITYGDFTMKKEWKTFLESLPFEKVFLYKDELGDHSELKNLQPPAILKANPVVSEGNKLDFEVLITAEELNRFRDLQELITRLSQRLEQG